jgi:hypothetical protein
MHPHDKKWVKDQLAQLPPKLKVKAAQSYKEVYEKALEAEPVSYKKVGFARCTANTRLRQYVEKIKLHLQQNER